MKPSEDLFLLIKSLSKTEKGYFQKYAQLHSSGKENNYIKLFYAIEKQASYEESKIVAQFKKEAFVKQLTVTKNYLYKLILKSLRSYYSEISTDSELKILLHESEILIAKQLYNQAAKHLDRIKEKAKQFELYNCILDVLNMERGLILKTKKIKELEEEYEKIALAEKDAINKIGNILFYKNESNRLYNLYLKTGESQNKDVLKETKKLLEHPFMLNEEKALSITAKCYFNKIQSTYYFITCDYTQALVYTKKYLAYLEKSSTILSLRSLVSEYLNVLSLCIKLNAWSDFEIYLNKVREPALYFKEKENVKHFAISSSYLLELKKEITLKSTSKAEIIINQLQMYLENHAQYMHRDFAIVSYAYISIMYFYMKNYKQALKWVNEAINNTDTSARIDVQCFIRIFNLLVHYELGNFDLIENNYLTTYNYIKRNAKLSMFETSILKFIREIASAKNQASKSKLFQQFHLELSSGKLNTDNEFFTIFDFSGWVTSKK